MSASRKSVFLVGGWPGEAGGVAGCPPQRRGPRLVGAVVRLVVPGGGGIVRPWSCGGVQQWLAGLEARCLFDLRWRGNGTGTVVAVGGGWVAALWRWRSWDFFVFVFAAVNLLNALNICSAGELRAEPRAMRLVNHPFRLDSQRLLSYLTSMRVLTLAVTPAISTTFWNTIYFYTASATAGNHSYDCARGRHRTVSAAASRRHVDASLDLFARKSPRSLRDSAGKRTLSARRLFFVDGGSIN